MHDIAIEVSGHEIYGGNSNLVDNLDERVRHVSFEGCDSLRRSYRKTRIRTYLHYGFQNIVSDDLLFRNLLATCTCLRTLDLSNLHFSILPDSIGKLLHLRYLDLSDNFDLEVIPKSITKLHNLIFFGINNCGMVENLPLGIGKLTNLQTLERFMLGKANFSGTRFFDELDDLKALVGLRGDLFIEIQIPSNGISLQDVNREGAYLSGKEQLSTVSIVIEVTENGTRLDFEEELLEKLCPHSNLKMFMLGGYNCVTMPSWGAGDSMCTFLPNLVILTFIDCQGLQSLPRLGKLRHLRHLHVEGLPNLEYVEDTRNVASNSAVGSDVGELSFFPRLQRLKLERLPKLKSWWPSSSSSPILSQLRICQILDCPEMTSIPVCPYAVCVVIRDNTRSLELNLRDDPISPSSPRRDLTTSHLGCLQLMPLEYTQFPTSLLIRDDKEVERLSEVRELFRNCFSSTLRVLKVYNCFELRSLYGAIEYLSGLESLSICFCRSLLSAKAEEGEEKDGIPWQHLGQTLLSLELGIDSMKNLPEGMQYLTSLQSLELSGCTQLQSLPDWMPKLTSLECFTIMDCTEQLKERCHQPTGDQWCLIRHIPKVALNSGVSLRW